MNDEFLVVVSCGKSKIWDRRPDAGPAPACEAYTSPVFKASRRYAERFGGRWLILSAKYGFIDPLFTIPANYNMAFYDGDSIPLVALRQQVIEMQLTHFKIVGVLGSAMYWRRVEQAFSGLSVVLRHINGNVGFPPTFQRLVSTLIANGTPFTSEQP